jgi:hypothetical protein
MTPTITAFEASPDRGRGLARDMPVRWALEEVGQPYEVRLVSFKAMKEPAHLARQPFGQIPTYEEGDLALFETGAIILHIAEHHPGLLPDDANARARAIAWMFAAKSTVEPPIVERETAILFEKDKPWFENRLPILDDRDERCVGQENLGPEDLDVPVTAVLHNRSYDPGLLERGRLLDVELFDRLHPDRQSDVFNAELHHSKKRYQAEHEQHAEHGKSEGKEFWPQTGCRRDEPHRDERHRHRL